jgi:putative membrane protein
MMGFSLVGILLMVLFWSVLIFLAVWVVKVLFTDGGRHSPDQAGPGPSARDILDQRYARGEIDREQYRRMKQDLETADMD